MCRVDLAGWGHQLEMLVMKLVLDVMLELIDSLGRVTGTED